MKPAGTEARGVRQARGVTAVAGGVLLTVMVLCGCTAVGPKYVKPKLSVPDAWTRATTSGSPATQDHPEDLSHWWRQLGDPVLSGLIERSLGGQPGHAFGSGKTARGPCSAQAGRSRALPHGDRFHLHQP
jgi:outer membrane protein TolC